MSPKTRTPARKAAKASKTAARKGSKKGPKKGSKKGAKGAASARRSRPAAVRKAARPAKPTPAQGGNGHAHCAASDPFGDPCQNLPRRPSKYCVIHSYLDR